MYEILIHPQEMIFLAPKITVSFKDKVRNFPKFLRATYNIQKYYISYFLRLKAKLTNVAGNFDLSRKKEKELYLKGHCHSKFAFFF